MITRCSLRTLISISTKLVSSLFPNLFFFFKSIIIHHREINRFGLFETGIVDSRKRSREVSSVAAAPMNLPPPKPSQVIHLSELLQNHNRKAPNVVSTGLRLSHEQSQNREQLLSSFSLLPVDLAGNIKRQRYELDRFIQTQVTKMWFSLPFSRKLFIYFLCVVC